MDLGDVHGCLLRAIFSLLSSFVISYWLTPKIASFSHKAKWHARPNHRSSHDNYIPNTGGILLFMSVLVPVFIFSRFNYADDATLLIVAFLVLFVTGVVDDLKSVNVISKFLGQFFPALLILLSLANQDIMVPFLKSSDALSINLRYGIWIFIIVGIINAYNLIDGIDGLALGLGIIAGSLFGIYFFINHACNLAVIGFALAGGMAGMLRYNLYNGKNKIFIGDSGSLLIGGIISLFALKFIEGGGTVNINFTSSMIAGIIFIPVADLFRMIGRRLIKKASPFVADRNHIHHILIDRFSINHFSATVILSIAQLIIFFIFLFYNRLIGKYELVFTIALFIIYVGVVEWMSFRNSRKLD